MNPLYLKNFRKKTGLNQKDFASSASMSVNSLKSYESGRRELTLDKFQEIKEAFGYIREADSERLRVMIDYLRITFKSVRDLSVFCRKYLGVSFKYFTSSPTGLMNYNRVWRLGDVWLFDYHDKQDTGNFQITLQLSGKGCRQMELYLEYLGIDWFTFLSRFKSDFPDLNVSRIDIAIDELYLGKEREDEQFMLSDLLVKIYRDEVEFDHLKTWSMVDGGKIMTGNSSSMSEGRQGLSLYFGSRQSEMYFNFYEKRFEYARREGITVEESLSIFEVWNRYELRFTNSKANGVIDEYLSGVDLAEIARGIVNAKMQVYDGTNAYGVYMADDKWQRLFGGSQPLRLTVRPEEFNIDRTVRWLMDYVSNSLAMVSEYDRRTNQEYVKMIINSGEIDEVKAKKLDDAVLTYNIRFGVKVEDECFC